MKILDSFLERYFHPRVSPLGLAVFRILYLLVLLAEVTQLYYFRHLVFDRIPYIDVGEVDFTPLLLLWMFVIVCLLLGLFTRTAAVANYIITVAIISPLSAYEYHVDCIYIAVNFLIMFMPISKCLSLDNVLNRLRFGLKSEDSNETERVSVANYYTLVLITIGVVYFDSIFHKLGGTIWPQGLAVWIPASMPFATWLDLSDLLDQRLLMMAACYLTLFLEAFFILLMWFRSTRIVIFLIGVGLHLGIFLAFPIPWFALIMLTLYLPLLPPPWWEKLVARLKVSNHRLTIHYAQDHYLARAIAVCLASFDVRGTLAFEKHSSREANIGHPHLYAVDKDGQRTTGLSAVRIALWKTGLLAPLAFVAVVPGLNRAFIFFERVCSGSDDGTSKQHRTARTDNASPNAPPLAPPFWTPRVQGVLWILFLLTWMGLQSCWTIRSPGVLKLASYFGCVSTLQAVNKSLNKLNQTSSWFFGITSHGVFVDSHFQGFNHNIAVVYVDPLGSEKWLPIIGKNGQTGWMASGRQWAKWVFRVNSPQIQPDRLAGGIRDFTSFWLKKSGKSHLHEHRFKIMARRIDIPKIWTKGFFRRQLNEPWVEAGTALWKDRRFTSSIQNIEKI